MSICLAESWDENRSTYIFCPNEFIFRLFQSSIITLRPLGLLPPIVNARLIFLKIQLYISAWDARTLPVKLANLLISTLLDDFFQRVYTVFGFLSRFDDPTVNQGHFLEEIRPKVIIIGVQLRSPLHYLSRCDDRFMARVLFIGSDDW